jgi:hypothetical protein
MKLDVEGGCQTQDGKFITSGPIGLWPFCLDLVRHPDMCEHDFPQVCVEVLFWTCMAAMTSSKKR